jgi:hypothetical protein
VPLPTLCRVLRRSEAEVLAMATHLGLAGDRRLRAVRGGGGGEPRRKYAFRSIRGGRHGKD